MTGNGVCGGDPECSVREKPRLDASVSDEVGEKSDITTDEGRREKERERYRERNRDGF